MDFDQGPLTGITNVAYKLETPGGQVDSGKRGQIKATLPSM